MKVHEDGKPRNVRGSVRSRATPSENLRIKKLRKEHQEEEERRLTEGEKDELMTSAADPNRRKLLRMVNIFMVCLFCETMKKMKCKSRRERLNLRL
jgi:hypothetical protein